MKNYPKYCNETQQVTDREQKQKTLKLSSIMNVIWHYLLKIFPDNKDLLVRQQTDCFGNICWTVYDPMTSCSATFACTTDMLTWIKQYYSRRYL